MFFSTCSAGALSGPDFCFIFAPCGYDEPEILPSGSPSIGLTGADGGQAMPNSSVNRPTLTFHSTPPGSTSLLQVSTHSEEVQSWRAALYGVLGVDLTEIQGLGPSLVAGRNEQNKFWRAI